MEWSPHPQPPAHQSKLVLKWLWQRSRAVTTSHWPARRRVSDDFRHVVLPYFLSCFSKNAEPAHVSLLKWQSDQKFSVELGKRVVWHNSFSIIKFIQLAFIWPSDVPSSLPSEVLCHTDKKLFCDQDLPNQTEIILPHCDLFAWFVVLLLLPCVICISVHIHQEFTERLGYLVYGAYNFSAVIVLLNMLIAMMSRSFDSIQVSEQWSAPVGCCRAWCWLYM